MTKEELVNQIKEKNMDIPIEKVDEYLEQMKAENRIEVNEQTNQFRGNLDYLPKFIESLKKEEEIKVPFNKDERIKLKRKGLINKQEFTDKGNKLVKNVIDRIEDTDKFYPIIRHGYLHLKHKLDTKKDYPDDLIKICKEQMGFDLNKRTPHLLEDAELFEIDPKTIWILQMTDNDIFERNLPFRKFVIDCNLNIDKYWFKGFLVIGDEVNRTWVWTYFGLRDGYCDEFLLFTLDPEGTYHGSKEEAQKDKGVITSTIGIDKKPLNKRRIFICNFIDFLNNPEVKIIKFERSQKNVERRLRQGKEILPSAHKIIIRGELKTYIEKMHDPTGVIYSHKFIVRGHFKRFWNKKRFRKLYDELEHNRLPKNKDGSEKYYVDSRIKEGEKILMIWNKPFVKGHSRDSPMLSRGFMKRSIDTIIEQWKLSGVVTLTQDETRRYIPKEEIK